MFSSVAQKLLEQGPSRRLPVLIFYPSNRPFLQGYLYRHDQGFPLRTAVHHHQLQSTHTTHTHQYTKTQIKTQHIQRHTGKTPPIKVIYFMQHHKTFQEIPSVCVWEREKRKKEKTHRRKECSSCFWVNTIYCISKWKLGSEDLIYLHLSTNCVTEQHDITVDDRSGQTQCAAIEWLRPHWLIAHVHYVQSVAKHCQWKGREHSSQMNEFHLFTFLSDLCLSYKHSRESQCDRWWHQ